MEYFDVVDENGIPTGKTVERVKAHEEGIRHRTAHVWIVRKVDGRTQILLQKRCKSKDSFPGCYDISSAGHIPAGADYISSALRELKEELGVSVDAKELKDCGMHKLDVNAEFYGKPFIDRQISKVYLLNLDWDETAFSVQEEEIESVLWMDFEACMQAVKDKSIPNCIDPSELEMLRAFL
jgi:isopentenyldiphosphate isomerase